MRLEIISGLKAEYSIKLRRGSFSLGRSSDNNFVLDHPAVSEHHALIQVKDGEVLLEDTGSNNGTYLNGVRLKKKIALNDGDSIVFGTNVEAQVFLDASNDEDPELEKAPSPKELKQRKSTLAKRFSAIIAIALVLSTAYFYINNSSLSQEEINVFIDQTLQASTGLSDELAPEPESVEATQVAEVSIEPEENAPVELTLKQQIDFQDYDITNFTVASDGEYEIVLNGLTRGAKAFTDQEIRIDEFPSSFEDLTYISTSTKDKFNTESEFISFTVSKDIFIFIIWDERFEEKPDWMSSYSRLPTQFNMSASGGAVYDIYRAEYPSGNVVLGANYTEAEDGDFGMYLIVVAPTTILATLPASPSGSGLPSVTIGSGTGYAFAANVLSTAPQDLWWNSSQLIPNPGKMLSLGEWDSLSDIPEEIDYQLLEYGPFNPQVNEVFILEMGQFENISRAAIRILEVSPSFLTIEFIFPF